MSRIVTLQAAFPVSLSEVDVIASVSDENSRIWFAIYPTGATVTDPTKVIAGTDDLDAPATDSTNTRREVVAGSKVGDRFKDIPKNATYDIYAVAAAFDGSSPGAVAGPFVVTVADEYVVAPYPPGVAFPTNANPAPPDGVASTLPDALAGDNWWYSYITTMLGNKSGTVNFEVSTTGATAYAGLYPAGAPAPTRAELVAGTGATDFGSAVLTADTPANVVLTPGSEQFNLFATFAKAGEDSADVFFLGSFSVLDDTVAPYIPWGTGVAVSPTMPVGIANFEDGNRAIAVIPQTVIISAN